MNSDLSIKTVFASEGLFQDRGTDDGKTAYPSSRSRSPLAQGQGERHKPL